MVVITDDRSSSTVEEIRSAAKPLEDKAIHVIAVGIGETPDVSQLEKMTQKTDDVIAAPGDVDPAELGNRIMEKAFQRTFTIIITTYNRTWVMQFFLFLVQTICFPQKFAKKIS